MGCICNVVNLPADFDHKNPAPGYTKELNESIKGCLRPTDERPNSGEVLQHVTKKYSELKDKLEKKGSPDPATLPQKGVSGRKNKQTPAYQPTRVYKQNPGIFGGIGGRLGGGSGGGIFGGGYGGPGGALENMGYGTPNPIGQMRPQRQALLPQQRRNTDPNMGRMGGYGGGTPGPRFFPGGPPQGRRRCR
jgi:hypothetical protein